MVPQCCFQNFVFKSNIHILLVFFIALVISNISIEMFFYFELMFILFVGCKPMDRLKLRNNNDTRAVEKYI